MKNLCSNLLISLSNRGTHALTLIVLIGIFIPAVGNVFKPFITESIFLLLCLSFLKLDIEKFKTNIKKPKIIILTTIWTALILPLIIGLILKITNVQELFPDLYLGFILQAVSSPMMATPALAALMGLDSTLVLITMISSTALIPFTVPLFIYLFVEAAINISPLFLGVKLFLMLMGSAILGIVFKKILGKKNLNANKEKIDGVNIILLFIFVTGIMQGVGQIFIERPLFSFGLLVLSFIVFSLFFFATVILFRKIGKLRAYSLGLMVAQRNMGLMIAAMGEALPSLTLVYFAISQFPIYLSPQLLHPFIKKVLEKIKS